MKAARLILLCALIASAGLAGAEKPAGASAPPATNAPAARPELISLTRKMERIIIPEIDFRQANIQDIVAFLTLAGRENDKTGGADTGVNLILNIGKTQVPEITFTARNISLLQTLKVVTKVAGLRFTVEGNVVMIEPE